MNKLQVFIARFLAVLSTIALALVVGTVLVDKAVHNSVSDITLQILIISTVLTAFFWAWDRSEEFE